MLKRTLQTWRLSAALDCLKAVAETCQVVTIILATMTPLALLSVNLVTSRYLAAFGQPGLASFGDVASYLTAMLPVILQGILQVILLIGGFVALPLLTRWIATGSQDHSFIDAFGWLEPGRPGMRRGLGLYLVTHAPALGTASLLVAAFFSPEAFAPSWWSPLIWWSPLFLGAAVLGWVLFRPSAKGESGVKRRIETIAIFLYANLVLIVWLACLARVTLTLLTPQLIGLSPGEGAGVATSIVLVLLFLYLLASTTRWEIATAVVVGMCLTVLAAYGDRPITALALRYAQLGGGVPMTYRPTAKDAAPVQACLVLATGDSRIVWVPKLDKDKTCAWTGFRDRLAHSATQANAGSAALDVRVFKREDLYDKP